MKDKTPTKIEFKCPECGVVDTDMIRVTRRGFNTKFYTTDSEGEEVEAEPNGYATCDECKAVFGYRLNYKIIPTIALFARVKGDEDDTTE